MGRDDSDFNLSAKFPWYFSVVLSVVAFVILRWVLPVLISPDAFPAGPFVHGLSRNAWLVALVLLIPAPLAYIRSRLSRPTR